MSVELTCFVKKRNYCLLQNSTFGSVFLSKSRCANGVLPEVGHVISCNLFNFLVTDKGWRLEENVSACGSQVQSEAVVSLCSMLECVDCRRDICFLTSDEFPDQRILLREVNSLSGLPAEGDMVPCTVFSGPRGLFAVELNFGDDSTEDSSECDDLLESDTVLECTYVNEVRGFCFLESNEHDRVFLHVTKTPLLQLPEVGHYVTCDVYDGSRGPYAVVVAQTDTDTDFETETDFSETPMGANTALPRQLVIDSGFCREDIIDADQVTNDMVCVICLALVRDPQLIVKCGHSFCRRCLANHSLAENAFCPTCRGPTDVVVEDARLRRYVAQLRIKCHKCPWSGRVDELDAHTCASQ